MLMKYLVCFNSPVRKNTPLLTNNAGIDLRGNENQASLAAANSIS
jgi:hypothetical protein